MSKKQGSKKILDLLFSEPKEIADGITIEKLSPMFFDVTKLKVQPEPLYRMDMNDHRYYYKFDENEIGRAHV